MHSKLLQVYSLVALFSCCRRPVVCRTVSSSLLFFCAEKKMQKTYRKKEREAKEAQAVRPNILTGIKNNTMGTAYTYNDTKQSRTTTTTRTIEKES